MSETQQLIDLMRQQMVQMQITQEKLIHVSEENTQLRNDLAAARTTPGESLASGLTPQTKKPDRPIVESDLSDSDWVLFEDSWQRYKVMCRLSRAVDIFHELRAACIPSINKILVELVGTERLNSASEEELLGHIRKVAVQGVHKEVHRQRFARITQADGESVNKFVAKLKASASLCEFQVTCHNPECRQSVSYSEEMVAHQMIGGLANPDYQAKILAEAATVTTFQQKFDKLVSLETTEMATTHLNPSISHAPSAASAQRSQYSRDRAGTPATKPLPAQKPLDKQDGREFRCQG